MYIALVIILMVFYIWFSVKKPGLALLTAPILCAVLINVFAACNRYSLPDPVVYAIFLTPLIFLATLLTIALVGADGDSEQGGEEYQGGEEAGIYHRVG